MTAQDPTADCSVRIERDRRASGSATAGLIRIDPAAWVRRRVRQAAPDLTEDLIAWAQTPRPTDVNRRIPGMSLCGQRPHDWRLLARAWCAVRGYRLAHPGLIKHRATRLHDPVWILRATTATGIPVVVLGRNNEAQAPTVWYDAADVWDWLDADTVIITCSGGHQWMWRTGRELITATGRVTTLAVEWGPDLDAPFSECRRCAADRTGTAPDVCDCGGTPWIVCPRCGRRCGLDLPRITPHSSPAPIAADGPAST